MKTFIYKFLILIIIQTFPFPVFCSWQDSSELKKPETEFVSDTLVNDTITVYTCPMHPEILSNKPGNCPECGMDLVKKSSSSTDNHEGQHKMGMMSMPMSDMNNPKEKKQLNKMVIVMGTMMGIMMIMLLVVGL